MNPLQCSKRCACSSDPDRVGPRISCFDIWTDGCTGCASGRLWSSPGRWPVTVRVTSLKGPAAGQYYVAEAGSYYLAAGEPPGRWFGVGLRV